MGTYCEGVMVVFFSGLQEQRWQITEYRQTKDKPERPSEEKHMKQNMEIVGAGIREIFIIS